MRRMRYQDPFPSLLDDEFVDHGLKLVERHDWNAVPPRVPYVRFHDARHTAATLLLSKGVHPKVVSEMLGHSTVANTLDVYSHVTASMHKEAAKVMDGIFG